MSQGRKRLRPEKLNEDEDDEKQARRRRPPPPPPQPSASVKVVVVLAPTVMSSDMHAVPKMQRDAESCAKWTRSLHNTSTETTIALARITIKKRLKQAFVSSSTKEVDWRALVTKMFALYDTAFLQGELGAYLLRHNVRVQVLEDVETAAAAAASVVVRVNLRTVAALSVSREHPVEMCGVRCTSKLDCLQIACEHQLTKLVQLTLCTSSGMRAHLERRLFGHVYHDTLDLMPSDLLGMVANDFLTDREAMHLGSLNRDTLTAMKPRYVVKKAMPSVQAFMSFPVVRIGAPKSLTVSNVRDLPAVSELQASHLHINFNMPIPRDFVLPAGLSSLTFCDRFNRSIEMLVLPDSLKKLRMGQEFNQHLPASLPDGLKELYVGGAYNRSSPLPTLPDTLRTLEFGSSFDQPLDNAWKQLPASLETIRFGRSFNRSLVDVKWPRALHTLVLGREFAQPVSEWNLPATLHQLDVEGTVQGDIRGLVFPEHLDTLTLNSLGAQAQYLQHLRLPSHLSRLHFGRYFDQPLHGLVCPPRLHTLTFGETFDQPVAGVLVLPDSLRVLQFRSGAQSIVGLPLPPALETLGLGKFYSQPLRGVTLPATLRNFTMRISDSNREDASSWLSRDKPIHTIEFALEYIDLIAFQLPSCLDTLLLTNSIERVDGLEKTLAHLDRLKTFRLTSYNFDQPIAHLTLPDSVETFEIGSTDGSAFNHPLMHMRTTSRLHTLVLHEPFNQPLTPLKRLSHLHALHLGQGFAHRLDATVLPESLRTLHVNVDTITDLCFPDWLTELRILGGDWGNDEETVLDDVHLPASLLTLSLEGIFSPLQPDQLPLHLDTLVFEGYNQRIDTLRLPASLRVLRLGTFFNQPLDHVTFPAHLHTLQLGVYFSHELDSARLPQRLQTLVLDQNYAFPLGELYASINHLVIKKGDDDAEWIDRYAQVEP